MFGKILAFDSITHADQFVLVSRAIFKEIARSQPIPGTGDSANNRPQLTQMIGTPSAWRSIAQMQSYRCG